MFINCGVCVARNLGIETAQNEWIAYLDTDNQIYSIFFEEFAFSISKSKKKCFYAQLCHPKLGIIGRTFNYKKLKKANYIDLGVFVHHKSLIEKYGNFDIRLKRLVDWDLILRFTKHHKPYFIPKVLLDYNDDNNIERITNTVPLDDAMKIIKMKH